MSCTTRAFPCPSMLQLFCGDKTFRQGQGNRKAGQARRYGKAFAPATKAFGLWVYARRSSLPCPAFRQKKDTKGLISSFRRSGGQIVLVILACLSLAISIYLTIVHYNSNTPLVCSASGLVNCENVLTSSYSVVPGTAIPVSIPGILWSIVALALPLAVLKFGAELRRVRIAEVIWGIFGLLTVFYLVYAEIVQIHNICAWCTGVHVIVLSYLLLAVVLLQEPVVDDEEVVYEDEASDIPV